MKSAWFMQTEKGTLGIGLNPENGGLGYAVMDADQKLRVAMGRSPEGEWGMAFVDGGIGVIDNNGKPRVTVGRSPEGQWGVRVMDEAGAAVGSLP